MKKFSKFLDEAGRCWPGYKPVPGKKPYTLGSCRKEEVEQIDEISKETASKYLTAPQGKGANKYKVSSDKSVYPNIETMSKHSANVRRALKRSEGSSLYKKPDYYKEEALDEKMISVQNADGHLLKVASQFKDIYKKHGYKPVPGTRLESAEQLDEYESKGGVYKHSAKLERGEKETDFRKMHTAGNKLNKQKTSEADRNMGIRWDSAELSKAQSKKTLMNVHKNLPEEYEADDGPLTEDQLEQIQEVAAWQRKEGKSESGGLNRKGIESYRRENPGSKLSMAVTTKPSKLKPGSKAANRRKSFCARMGGMKRRLTSAKTARDPDSRINKALRKWNC
jgi:hypothetical protein